MPTTDELFKLALSHHHAGRLPEAEHLYRQILAAEPNNAEAWHCLGLIAYQVGNPGLAAYIDASLALRPANPEAYNNLGLAYRAQQKLDQAIACYHRALNLNADFAEAHNNLGDVLKEQNRAEEAIACFNRAIELRPDFYEAHYNCGNVFKDIRKLDEAASCYRRDLHCSPNSCRRRPLFPKKPKADPSQDE